MTGVLQGLAATTRDVNLSPPTSEDSYIYIYTLMSFRKTPKKDIRNMSFALLVEI
jgi:hypothetical protein